MGILTGPIDALVDMLAANTGFSRWLGLAALDATEARKRIYVEGVGPDDVDAETMTRDELAALRPFCVVYPDGSNGYQFTRNGMPGCYTGAGNVLAVLSREYSPGLSISQHWAEAAALLEPIIHNTAGGEPGLIQQAQTAGFLPFTKLTVVFAGRTPAEHRIDYGDAFDVVLVFEYGGP